MGMQEPLDDPFDREPTSEVRPTDPRARRLTIDTGLRASAAEEAWVTVTDDSGAVFFEGPPSADGCLDVSFAGAPHVRFAHILVETPRLHRQAVVELGHGWTPHAFTS